VSPEDPAAPSRLGPTVDELHDRRLARLTQRLGIALARLGYTRAATRRMTLDEQLELLRRSYDRLMAAPRSRRAS